MRYLMMSALILALTSNALAIVADDAFLEGFPDVPLIEGISEITSERIVFDTPSGTVAEILMASTGPAKQVLDRYAAALPAFGWLCQRSDLTLRCAREGYSLLFTNKSPGKGKERIILRLEPNK